MDMTVDELLKRKIALENEISEFVTKRLNEFMEDSGVGIRSVYLSLDDVKELANKNPVYTFVKAEVRLAL